MPTRRHDRRPPDCTGACRHVSDLPGCPRISAIEGKPEAICSSCAFRLVTPTGPPAHDHARAQSPLRRPAPSRADIETTQAIVAVARPLGIAVHDHIIVGKDGHASLKGLKLI